MTETEKWLYDLRLVELAKEIKEVEKIEKKSNIDKPDSKKETKK